MASQKTTPTMKDVAKEAGVALGTVSKVFNGVPVGETYRLKVEAAAEKLGYQLNSYARGLRSNKTNTIALVIPSLAHPFYSLFADHVSTSLQKRNYKMMVVTTSYHPDTEQQCIDMVQQNKVDGIIAITYNPNLTIAENLPFVIVDRRFSTPVPCVTSDNFSGGEIAAKKLSELGCKNLLFCGKSSQIVGEADKRGPGFCSYCTQYNIPFYSLSIYDEDGDDCIRQFIIEHTHNGHFLYDGIFCNTDRLALFVKNELELLGVSVPEQVQIIGYDGIRKFGTGDYFCSTIVQPLEEMAENAVEILLNEDRAKTPALICIPVTYAAGGTTRE